MDDEDNKGRHLIKRSDETLPTREDYVSSPIRHGLLHRVMSRFVAKLNTKTIDANSDEIRALQAYVAESGKLADVAMEADRKIARYVHDRDDIIADDRRVHRDQMEENEYQRELNRKRRAASLQAVDGDYDRIRTDAERADGLAAAAHEAALADASAKVERAKWGRDAFQQTLPLRKERLEHLYKMGALDAEIDRLISEGERDKKTGDVGRTRSATAPDAAVPLQQLLDEISAEIDLARQTQTSDQQLAALYAFRARLKAKLEQAQAGKAAGNDPPAA